MRTKDQRRIAMKKVHAHHEDARYYCSHRESEYFRQNDDDHGSYSVNKECQIEPALEYATLSDCANVTAL